jgi:CO dehydrogenase/acetyl-CoA synthase epsilon subunit
MNVESSTMFLVVNAIELVGLQQRTILIIGNLLTENESLELIYKIIS